MSLFVCVAEFPSCCQLSENASWPYFILLATSLRPRKQNDLVFYCDVFAFFRTTFPCQQVCCCPRLPTQQNSILRLSLHRRDSNFEKREISLWEYHRICTTSISGIPLAGPAMASYGWTYVTRQLFYWGVGVLAGTTKVAKKRGSRTTRSSISSVLNCLQTKLSLLPAAGPTGLLWSELRAGSSPTPRSSTRSRHWVASASVPTSGVSSLACNHFDRLLFFSK